MPKIKPSARIAIIYFILGVLWILVSDSIVNLFVHDKKSILEIQIFKGWFFVIVSSLLIYSLGAHYNRHLNNKIRELKNANEDLKLFFYKASHDLRGPIKSILGLTNIIDLYLRSGELPIAINHIELSAKKADHLIYDLEQLTNIIEGPLNVAPINFHALIKKIIKYQYQNNHDLVDKIDFALKVNIDNYESNPYLIELALEKVMENAIIFTAPFKDNPQIETCVKSVSDGIEVSIKDNGIGIEGFQVNKIFNMFYRGTEASKGSGLGLYIAKMAIERLNGKIWVKSTYRKESTFTIFLPKVA
ncbi:HAMP domain-containing histidine kinase [Fulvivirga sp. 29W222]|uniref:histidine kinase n=1 Tax=Fulvivirga marina TaxID=2494733 RepID=A0A937G2V0_9BACT|nr:HAMP domain-containing sensor histidine kinase [Fulvivirga marina]MBL6449018.1 HAMP domain-containing histidine kinase [Fulvivirga marina]